MKRDTKRLEKPQLVLQAALGVSFLLLEALYFFGANITELDVQAVLTAGFIVFVVRGLRRR